MEGTKVSNGYIYALENRSLGKHVIKIGRTTRDPNSRAHEIYSGATGVPERFDVALIHAVADCVQAEKFIHTRLNAYRINAKREFFKIPLDIVQKVVIDVCESINKIYNYTNQGVVFFRKEDKHPGQIDSTLDGFQFQDYANILYVNPKSIIVPPPVNTSILTEDQLGRIEIIGLIFSELLSISASELRTLYSQDRHPGREIIIWEHIVKAFLKFDGVEHLDIEQKKEILALLLMRSMMPTHYALLQIKPKWVTRRIAKHVLAGYELPPQPISVSIS